MELNEIRSNIDEVDNNLLDSFIERMHLSEEIAKLKQQNNTPLIHKMREREVLQRMQERSGEYEYYAYEFFSTIIGLSKVRQYELFPHSSNIRTSIEEALAAGEECFPRTGTIACQGIEGSHSQVACDKLFPRGTVLFVKTFKAVFDAVDSGFCDFGVVPIENSTNGSVRSVYELLLNRRFSIVRMLNLHVSHELMANPGVEFDDIREIYNYTRFVCISKKPAIYAGADKISIILSSENEPGALCSSLSKFAVRGINMSKLESYPVAGRNFEFAFYIDLEASVREQGVISMLEELENSNEYCVFLGNYSVV